MSPTVSRARVGRAVLVGVVVLVLLLAGLLSTSWLMSGTSRATETVEDVAAVDVRIDVGDVELVGWAREEVEVVVVQEEAPLHEPDVVVRRDGDRLVVTGECHRRLGWFSIGGCRTDLRLSLPAEVQAVVSTREGTVAATGMRGGTRLLTDRGPVRVAAQGGDLQASTLEGSIEVRDLTAATTDLRAPEGRIDVVVVTPGASLAARTEGGDVVLTVPAGGYALTADTGRGRIDLAEGVANDPASANRWTVGTGGGDFSARVTGAPTTPEG